MASPADAPPPRAAEARTDGERDGRLVTAYDTVARSYGDHLVDELEGKPFDRWLLGRLADLARRAGGPIVDAGCGPGHVTAHLAEHGAAVVGVDLSFGMVNQARRRFPHLTFVEGDLRSLPVPPDEPDGPGWAVVAAWYSLVHLAPSELPGAIRALTDAARPGGWVAFALHLGDEVRHLDDWWDLAVDVDFVLHERPVVLAAVAAAGLEDVEWYLRAPYPAHEVETERLYVLGRRPG